MSTFGWITLWIVVSSGILVALPFIRFKPRERDPQREAAINWLMKHQTNARGQRMTRREAERYLDASVDD